MVILLICVSLPAVALASSQSVQETVEEAESHPPETTPRPESYDLNPMSFLVKTLGYVTLIGLFVFLGLKGYRRLVYNGSGAQSPKIRVLGSSILGPKKSICVVEALGHILLLGVTDSQISVLLELPEDKLSEDIRSSLQQTKSRPNADFQKILSNWVKK